MHCIVCEKELERTNPSATAFTGHPGWGSRFDGVTAGNQPLEIHVCDDCLGERGHLVVLRKTVMRKTVVVEDWACSRCGARKRCGVCEKCAGEGR